ncbi:hypothetical protein ACFLV3_03375 [Chloroflexota bacterium]
MSIIKKFSLILILSIFIIISIVSCDGQQTVVPTDYDSVKKELADARIQIKSLQSQIEELEKQYNDEIGEADPIKVQYDALITEYNALVTEYEELSKQNKSNLTKIADLEILYQELKSADDLRAQQAAEVNEDNIEKDLFDAINTERTNNGLLPLAKGTNIILIAEENSRNMADSKQYVYADSSIAPYQEVFMATGYSSVDGITDAALTIWKSSVFRYKTNILNASAIYGTVGAYLANGIYYITFVASNFP